jgi:hypothetical protein
MHCGTNHIRQLNILLSPFKKRQNKPPSNVSCLTEFVQKSDITVRASYVVSEILAKKLDPSVTGKL